VQKGDYNKADLLFPHFSPDNHSRPLVVLNI
jgi:hypothetical protein